MSTNDCPESNISEHESWNQTLLTMFNGWLKPSRLNIDSCQSPPSTRCNFGRALDLFNAHGGKDVYKSVVMARPDVFIKPDGERLLIDLVNQSMVTFVWPHKCETSSWAAFQLVSDLYFGMPSHYLAGFHSACLGRSGCYSMAYQDKAGWSHVTKPQGAAFDMLSFEGAKGVAQSGHSCYRCIVNLQKNATAFWQPESSTLDGSFLKFSLLRAITSLFSGIQTHVSEFVPLTQKTAVGRGLPERQIAVPVNSLPSPWH